MIERITVYYLKLFRVQRAEQEYMKSILDPREVRTVGGIPTLSDLGIKDEIINEGYMPQIRDENIQKLADVYSRYEITIENRMYKAFHELERVIALRKGLRVPPPTLNIFQMGSFGENT